MRIAVVGIVGLLVGVAWPTLAGIHVGPRVPGAKAPTAPPTNSAAASGAKALPAAARTAQKLSPAPPESAASNKQVVVVGQGRIARCWDGKKRVEPEYCGSLRADRVFVRRLEALSSCPSALGLSGELELGFSLDFDDKSIHLRRGEKSKLPGSTVRGITACVADYVRDIPLEKIRRKYSKYLVYYKLSFYPPGSAPPRQPAEQSADDQQESSDVEATAVVQWDSVLLRSEPETGSVVARLVRGTRVQLLSRRGDWYRIRMRSKEGWVYRGSLGL